MLLVFELLAEGNKKEILRLFKQFVINFVYLPNSIVVLSNSVSRCFILHCDSNDFKDDHVKKDLGGLNSMFDIRLTNPPE